MQETLQFERIDDNQLLYRSQEFEIPGLEGSRPLRLWLPPDYYKSEQPWPLALFFDGQNIFDDEGTIAGGWHLDRILTERAAAKKPVPVVLALHHGPHRDQEMCPRDPFPGQSGKARLLLDWLDTFLLPRAFRKLHLRKEPAQTLIGGSSLGGLLALYALFYYPQNYGRALVMSPALWPDQFSIFQDIMLAKAHAKARVYIDHGEKEAPPEMPDIGRILFDQSKLMGDVLSVIGFDDKRMRWHADPEGEHNENSWRRRLPAALEFLYS